MATGILYVFLLNSVLFLKLKTVFIIWGKKERERGEPKLSGIMPQTYVLMGQPKEH